MKKILFGTFILVSPLSVFATDVAGMIGRVGGVIGAVLPVLGALAVVYFIWQVIQYTIADGTGKNAGGIVWGLIGLVVITAVYGFVNAIRQTLGV